MAKDPPLFARNPSLMKLHLGGARGVGLLNLIPGHVPSLYTFFRRKQPKSSGVAPLASFASCRLTEPLQAGILGTFE